MKKLIFVTLALMQTSFLSAQQIQFKIEDSESLLPISNVKIGSIRDHKIVTYTNDSGYFRLEVNHVDTLLIDKANYHPIYINVKQNKFDATHVIVISLVPLKEGQVHSRDLKTLSSFEYHFVHDTLGDDSNVKVHVFEGYNASKQRPVNKDKSFNIVDIKLGETHHHSSKSSYLQKK